MNCKKRKQVNTFSKQQMFDYCMKLTKAKKEVMFKWYSDMLFPVMHMYIDGQDITRPKRIQRAIWNYVYAEVVKKYPDNITEYRGTIAFSREYQAFIGTDAMVENVELKLPCNIEIKLPCNLEFSQVHVQAFCAQNKQAQSSLDFTGLVDPLDSYGTEYIEHWQKHIEKYLTALLTNPDCRFDFIELLRCISRDQFKPAGKLLVYTITTLPAFLEDIRARKVTIGINE